ncbi:UTP--glucose-1-phosphate uridylyltransferase [Rhodopirellula bahusiensis]|uniref:UDP-N-acetylglucosamine pyrophosphorylase n=1 Tax=Rhodopirellula bahusiensis TaxID=2014065 RepID=A0A2G1WAM1_9BACT|nr:UDPGP type 1 family protein [Rhodopirellula bahusiensis]PHQ36073.1 UDP-N-acetylglucosamine pyrophosphorylase [Rhodopirellula bahusiensis]
MSAAQPSAQNQSVLSFDELKSRLEPFQQTQLLRFWDSLDSNQQTHLSQQIAQVDFAQLKTLVEGNDKSVDFGELAARAAMPQAVASDGSGCDWTLEQAQQRGEEALRSGEIATVLVAGGQGTRLGFDQPKGMFPVGPVSERTLFQFFADRLIAAGEKYGVDVPLYLMTSEATHEDTRRYFEKNDYLGLKPEQVTIFQQGTMPAVDAATGDVLMADKGSLALSPDGHGGTLRALSRNGCMDEMRKNGRKHLFYFQVDNPLVGLCDPVFIGHHLLACSEMTTQVIRKRYPTEKVGNVVEIDGQTQIIEYSDLPDSAAEMTNSDGSLKLWAGNIAVHLFDLDFLERMLQLDASLPIHRASKKVPHVDAEGQQVKPDSPNATKFEQFIFDLLPHAKNTIVCEANPADAFAPVKNANGAATDTPELARQAICDLHRRWLRSCGVTVDDSVKVEINPRFAMDPAELSEKLGESGQTAAEQTISTDQYFC